MIKKPYILCAAYWHRANRLYKGQPENIRRGYVVAGWRHGNCIETHQELCTEKPYGVQGFLTSDNRFVSRRAAAKIAFEAGQTGNNVECLTSEDLY